MLGGRTSTLLIPPLLVLNSTGGQRTRIIVRWAQVHKTTTGQSTRSRPGITQSNESQSGIKPVWDVLLINQTTNGSYQAGTREVVRYMPECVQVALGRTTSIRQYA